MGMSYSYYSNCVDWTPADVHVDGGLCDLIDQAEDITRREFLTHVDHDNLAALETRLGYGPDFLMENDWHVSYHSSKWHGQTTYHFCWSAIEYVFIDPGVHAWDDLFTECAGT